MITTHGKISIGIDSHGGNITSFQYGDRHIFMPQQILIENGEPKVRGGSHICFPNFGPLVETENMKLPQHGITRGVELKQLSRIESVEASYLQDRFNILKHLPSSTIIPVTQHEQTYNPPMLFSDADHREFPFFFKLLSTIFFLPDGFLQQVTISHTEEDIFLRADTPIGLGIHPYFNTGKNDVRLCFNADDYIYTGMGTEYKPINITTGIVNNKCTITTNKFKAKVTCGGVFTEAPGSQIALWRSEENSPYLCVEPVVAYPQKFGTNQGVWLKKDASACEGWMMVKVEETY